MHQKILAHFFANDPKIYTHIKPDHSWFKLKPAAPEEYFYRLIREIAFQQLTGKAGNAIFSRFESLFRGKKILPTAVLRLNIEHMRATGLSYSKAAYIKNIAQAVVDKKLNFKQFPELEDEVIIKELTAIKGVGRWTAEMFLLFTLGRENIFSYGDLGLIKGMMKVYGLKKKPSKTRTSKIIKKWDPYKSYGSLALWSALDN